MDSSELQHKFLFFCFIAAGLVVGSVGFGCNWGLQATHLLQPEIVVKLMKDNGFDKVKLFEADPGALTALGKSGIQVMVGIPNNMLAPLAGSVNVAINWVTQNVSQYISKHGVDIRYVAVGNEPFLKDYGDQFMHTLFPALQNIQAAIIKAGLGRQVKVTVPFNGGVYLSDTGVPSGGDFRSDVRYLMISIVKFIHNNGAPIVVNIYPFLNLNSDPGFPPDFAFFDGTNKQPIHDGSATYTNVFDANYDTLVATLEKNGLGSMPIIVGEVGWPTDGGANANLKNARRFNQQLIDRIIQRKGTPKRSTPPDIYIFGLIDEDAKSVDPGNFERHWGIFQYDGSIKYQLNLANNKSLVPAKGVSYLPRRWCVMAQQASTSDPNLVPGISYACQHADCTSLGNGSSCGGLDARGNASYAFNMYYQAMNQSNGACKFNNLATVTAIDPSKGGCRFEIQLDLTKHQKKSTSSGSLEATNLVMLIVFVATLISLGI